ncbi:MAG: DNA mismatch repair protein MutS [Legionella sp.]|nr:MAG: DNA mismatch repair protein MutS [Legionella sp.]
MADDSLSDEDKALFRDHMRAVKPLKKQTQRDDTPKPKPAPPPKKRPAATIKEPQPSPYLSDFISENVLSESTLSYAQPSLPSQRLRDLRQGRIPWEARLDLHGLKADVARDSLTRFIQAQVENHKRCLLIIHGKGGHEGAPPVIKNLVNRWLPQFPEVLAFHSAVPKDGGQGAVYVLLKRNREC